MFVCVVSYIDILIGFKFIICGNSLRIKGIIVLLHEKVFLQFIFCNVSASRNELLFLLAADSSLYWIFAGLLLLPLVVTSAVLLMLIMKVSR